MASVIGIDVGTTGTKGVLINDKLEIISSAYKGYDFLRSDSNFVEQDAADWWAAAVYVVKECVKNYNRIEEIKGICISSQGATLVCTNEKGEPLSPARVWLDCRAAAQGEWINENYGEEFTYKKTGWRAINCFNLLQIMWIREHNKTLYDETSKYLSTNEYINYKLTGKFIGDPTNAAMSQLFNIVEKRWDVDLLEICGLNERSLARVLDVGEPLGSISEQAAEELGLTRNTTVFNSGHDQYLAAVGSGAVNIGDVLLSCGTSWGITKIVDAPYFDTEIFYSPGRHAIAGLWGIFAYTPAGGATLEWFRKNIAARSADNSIIPYDEVNTMVSETETGARGLFFLPHFSGSSCPTWSSESRATLMGLDVSHTKADIARAFMEGVGYDINWILESLQKSKVKLNSIKSLGGATKSRIWMQIVADITGLTIINPTYPDAPVMGAAFIAGKNCGIYESITKAYSTINKDSSIIEPNISAHKKYSDLFQDYKRKFELVRKSYLKN